MLIKLNLLTYMIFSFLKEGSTHTEQVWKNCCQCGDKLIIQVLIMKQIQCFLDTGMKHHWKTMRTSLNAVNDYVKICICPS